jgi:antitoxin component YwqK of YwqJK toxin-antitoxin module
LAEAPYVNGKEHGITRSYFESGALLREAPYKKGKLHGIVKVYRESGALWWESPYVDGKIHGIKKLFNNDEANIECLLLYKEDCEVASINI